MIKHHKSFLMIHALFALACRDLDRIFIAFSTLFYDLLRHVDEEWDMFLFSIREGTVPDLLGVREVHSHLQVSPAFTHMWCKQISRRENKLTFMQIRTVQQSFVKLVLHSRVKDGPRVSGQSSER